MDIGKVATICGTGGAIDTILAESLASNGIGVEMIEHQGGQAKASPRQFDIDKIGVELTFADLTDEAEIQAAIDRIITRRQKIDYLINCPDLRVNCSLENFESQAWDDTISFNLTSVFLSCKHVVPTMAARRVGKIINLSSDAAQVGAMNAAPYAATKAGVVALSKVLAREIAGQGITVNVVSFGLIGDDMPAFRDDLAIPDVPLGRSGRWKEVADMVLCLLDDKTSYVTGQIIHVNGGLFMPW